MKNQTIIVILAIIIFALFSIAAFADCYRDYCYSSNGDGTCTITEYRGFDINITIPDTWDGLTVTGIGNYVFARQFVISIAIGSRITAIGSNAFSDCAALSNITVNWNNNFYSSQDGVLFNKNKTELIRCPQGKSGIYSIPDSVTNISTWYAFRGCRNLVNITIGNSLTTINNFLFSDCESLSSITIGNGVTSIGNEAFDGCNSLTEITVNSANNFYSSLDGVLFNKNQTELILCPPKGKTGAYSIPDGVITVIDGAFGDCNDLTSITLPSSLETITVLAFIGCGSMTGITVNPANSFYWSVDGVLFNKNKMELIVYPQAKAGMYLIPDSVVILGYGAFNNCCGLTNITISDSVVTIRDSVFYGCSGLTSVTVGSGVVDIGNSAFSACYGLVGVYFRGDAPTLDSYVFHNTNATVYYIPGTSGWGTYYGGRPTAQWLPSAADVDLDYEVDMYDFAVLAENWGREGCDMANDWCSWADFDEDSYVDEFDLATLAEQWLFPVESF